MKRRMVLIGGGGHAKVVIDAVKSSKNYSIYGIVDPSLKPGGSVLDVKIIGGDDLLAGIFKKGITNAFIGIGSIGNCGIRKKIFNNLKDIGFRLPVIIHPNAIVASDVKLGEGTFIAAGAIVNCGTVIGRNAILNTASSVDHDCVLGDFVHVAPGATLSGCVKIGEETHIGTGAAVIQCLNIGIGCIVGAGATVRKNIKDRKKYL